MEVEAVLVTSQAETLLQLVVAMVLGMIMGGERSIAGKTAGMRTYALVAMGSALFIIVSASVQAAFLGVVNFDPLRVAAAVITGIGFIGAGIIIFRETTLRGLTTAAGLWVAAGVGIAVGFKMYMIASFAAVLTLFVFTIMWAVENYVESRIDPFFNTSRRTVVIGDDKEEKEG